MRLILASASPARLATLRAAGLHPDVVVAGVDESQFHADTPGDLAALLAREKAETVFASLGSPKDTIIIGCDSVLDFAGCPVGKPGSPEAALALLKRTRGRSGVLTTGHHVIVHGTGESPASHGGAPATQPGVRRLTRVGTTVVHVSHMSDEEIEAYVATGEPEQVAGGFTIDQLGGPFIDGIEGDPHNVVGVSLPLLRAMLAECHVSWTSLWTSSH